MPTGATTLSHDQHVPQTLCYLLCMAARVHTVLSPKSRRLSYRAASTKMRMDLEQGATRVLGSQVSDLVHFHFHSASWGIMGLGLPKYLIWTPSSHGSGISLRDTYVTYSACCRDVACLLMLFLSLLDGQPETTVLAR
mgnify:CR=1 FL=1